jgi:hypothetical protein
MPDAEPPAAPPPRLRPGGPPSGGGALVFSGQLAHTPRSAGVGVWSAARPSHAGRESVSPEGTGGDGASGVPLYQVRADLWRRHEAAVMHTPGSRVSGAPARADARCTCAVPCSLRRHTTAAHAWQSGRGTQGGLRVTSPQKTQTLPHGRALCRLRQVVGGPRQVLSMRAALEPPLTARAGECLAPGESLGASGPQLTLIRGLRRHAFERPAPSDAQEVAPLTQLLVVGGVVRAGTLAAPLGSEVAVAQLRVHGAEELSAWSRPVFLQSMVRLGSLKSRSFFLSFSPW